MSKAMGLLAVIVIAHLFIKELGVYAEEINPYNHDIGDDFEED